MKKLGLKLVIGLSLLVATPFTAAAAEFTDVPKSHWAYDSITKLSSQGIIEGYTGGSFKPGEYVTRAQAAKILGRTIDLPSSVKTPNFLDIDTTHWAYPEISALTQLGVFSNANYFNPDQPLTRVQMSKILVKGFDIKMDNNHLTSFNDVVEDSWKPYIITLAELGITNGVKPTYFGPYHKVTRSQMAAFTDRALTFDSKRDNGTIIYDPTFQMYVDSSNIENFVAKQSADLVNKERAAQGLGELKWDSELSKLATLKAEDMVKNNYFDHHSPTYGSPFEMAKKYGYSYRSFGENIAFGYNNPIEAVKGWMDSPGHRANILHHDYTNVGAGIAKDRNGRIYWVHMFSSK